MSNLSVKRLQAHTNNDLMVVNSARVSFNKVSTYDWQPQTGLTLKSADVGLIKRLARDDHWSPFAHPHECFDLTLTKEELLKFMVFKGAGFVVVPWHGGRVLIKGSLYAWVRDFKLLPEEYHWFIMDELQDSYPVSIDALGAKETFAYSEEVVPTRMIDILWLNKGNDSWMAEQELLSDCGHLASLTSISMRFKAPLFLARQLEKHHEDFVWNEVSRRYVSFDPEMFMPEDGFRLAPEPDPVTGKVSNKQGSISKTLKKLFGVNPLLILKCYHWISLKLYACLLKAGVAPEDARIVLPLTMMTEWVWTGSLTSWMRVYKLRSADGAQAKVKPIADMIEQQVIDAYPLTWERLKGGDTKDD